jgi:BRCT domain type II-containing protein
MIESVAQEKFYKDVCHDSHCPAVPNDPRPSRASSSTVAASSSHTTHSGGAPSAPSPNSGILKMLWGIFAHMTAH